MAAVTKAMKLPLVLLMLAVQCEAASTTSKERDYSDQAFSCSQKIAAVLRDPLSNAPNFETIHEATKWLGEHLPAEVRARFVDAGRAVSQSLADWEQHGMIHGPFWNLQALTGC